jgi:formiminoglutamase
MMYCVLVKFVNMFLKQSPYLREAAMVTYNINAIRYSDAPGQPNPSPNGLFGDEACAMARYSWHE